MRYRPGSRLLPPSPGPGCGCSGIQGAPRRETGMWVEVDLKGEVGGQMIQVESRSDQTRQSAARLQRIAGMGSQPGEAVGLLQCRAVRRRTRA